MSKSFIGSLKLSFGITWTLLALAACGAPGGPEAAVTQKPDALVNETSFSGFGQALSSSDQQSEWTMRADPRCTTVAPVGLANVIEAVVNRFNTAYSLTGGADEVIFINSSSHASNAGNIGVLVCASENVSAFSQGRTAAISLGLATMLKDEISAQPSLRAGDNGAQDKLLESALAFIVYHELAHIFLGHTRTRGQLYLGECCAKEIHADLFAADALRKAGYSMEGPNIVFAFLQRTNPSGSPAHPGTQLRSSIIHTAL